MPTFSQLPSGKWRAQVRRAGLYRAATFGSKREAKDWAMTVESQLTHVAASGFAPIPKAATLSDLIDKYLEGQAREGGKTKTATLAMFKRELGSVKLASLNAVVLRDFIDQRLKAGAGGVTISADMSYLSAVLKWGRHARKLDIPDMLALEARESLKHRGVSTRSREREREPTDDELARLSASTGSKGALIFRSDDKLPEASLISPKSREEMIGHLEDSPLSEQQRQDFVDFATDMAQAMGLERTTYKARQDQINEVSSKAEELLNSISKLCPESVEAMEVIDDLCAYSTAPPIELPALVMNHFRDRETHLLDDTRDWVRALKLAADHAATQIPVGRGSRPDQHYARSLVYQLVKAYWHMTDLQIPPADRSKWFVAFTEALGGKIGVSLGRDTVNDSIQEFAGNVGHIRQPPT